MINACHFILRRGHIQNLFYTNFLCKNFIKRKLVFTKIRKAILLRFSRNFCIDLP